MPVAALAGPIISGVGSIVGGISGAKAANKAADAQAKAAQAAADFSVKAGNNATDYGNQIFDYQRQIQNPYLQAGNSALAALTGRLGLNPSPALAGPMTHAGALANPFPPATGAPAASPAPSAMQILAGAKPPGYRFGGKVTGPGTGTSDSVPARLSTGEGILTAAAMRMPGVTEMVMHLNRMSDGKAPKVGGGRYATGGLVEPGPQGSMDPNPSPAPKPLLNTSGPTGVMTPNPTPNPGPVAQGGFQPGSIAPGWGPANPGDTTPHTFGTSLSGGPTPAPGPPGSTFGTQPGISGPNDPGNASMLNTSGGPTGVMTTPNGGFGAPVGSPAGGDGDFASPYSQTGDGSDGGNLLTGFNQRFQAPTVTDDPGFQFRLQQGQKALERSAAARGGLLSGGTAKDLADYSQGLASQEYGNAYGRAFGQFQDARNQYYQNQNNVYNRLMGITNVGQNAANQLTGAGTASAGNISGIDLNTGNQVGQDLTNAGTARASGYVGANNALSGILPGIGQSLSIYDLLRRQQGGAYPGGGPNIYGANG